MIRYYPGVDLVNRNRLQSVFLRRSGLLEEVFSERERKECLSRKDPWKHLAGRFAVKEACLKALRLGFSTAGIDHALGEIEVLAKNSRRSELLMHAWVAKVGRKRKISRGELSITYAGDYALATVVLVAESPCGSNISGSR